MGTSYSLWWWLLDLKNNPHMSNNNLRITRKNIEWLPLICCEHAQLNLRKLKHENDLWWISFKLSVFLASQLFYIVAYVSQYVVLSSC